MSAVRASTTLRWRAPCERGERVSRQSWRFGEPDRNRELEKNAQLFGLNNSAWAQNRRGVSVVRGGAS